MPIGRPPSASPRSSPVLGLVRTARPKQWIKNILVLAAPVAASEIFHARVVGPLTAIFFAYCLGASAVYLLNDTLDVEADRAHPTKRNRPIAAGIVSARTALTTAVVLAAAGLGLAAICNLKSLALLGFYLLVNVAYCVRLKHVALVDVMIVASGFVVRAAAGGIAISIPLSQWFLLTATFGSLFVAVGKRASDVVLVGEGASKTRKVLEDYPPEYLRFLLVFSAATSALSYGLWAFSVLDRDNGLPWPFLSMVAFVFLLLRYAMLVELGRGGEPEQVILRDRSAQIGALVFVAMFLVAVATK
jgi:decaprenyl-phosphate phosphoribosyltransferase